MTTTIYAIGAGQFAPAHLTREAWEAIQRSRLVLYFGELEGMAELLDAAGVHHRDVSTCAAFGRERAEAYATAAEEILREARASGPVSWVTQGNPAFLCGVTDVLVRRAPEAGFSVERLVGPSALDSILIDLDLKIAQTGLQVFDASRLLAHDIVPIPNVPCVLFQVARAETWLNPLDAPLRAGALATLQDQLLRAYPSDHAATLVTCARTTGARLHRQTIALGDLATNAFRVGPWDSLYIPATAKLRANGERVAQLRSYRHLETQYVTPLERLAASIGTSGDSHVS